MMGPTLIIVAAYRHIMGCDECLLEMSCKLADLMEVARDTQDELEKSRVSNDRPLNFDHELSINIRRINLIRRFIQRVHKDEHIRSLQIMMGL